MGLLDDVMKSATSITSPRTAALAQLWMFWLAPIIGAIVAGVVYGFFAEEKASKSVHTAMAS